MRPDTVHPHIRGENPNLLSNRHKFLGSPPHTWGKWGESFHVTGFLRFTPTYVGKIGFPFSNSGHIPVHPHIRGENVCSTLA